MSTEIQQYFTQWEHSLDGFQSHIGRYSDSLFMKPRSLPDAEALSILRVSSIGISGYLPPTKDVKQLFQEIMTKAEGQLPITCSIGFEEINSQQSKRGYDSISAIRGNGHSYFSYSANGSKVMNDREYAEEFIRDMISKISLPIGVSVKNTDYYLSHTDASMKLMVLRGGLDGENPCSFRCEVDWDGNTLIDRMFEVLPFIATDKRYDVCWRTGKSLPYGVTEDPDGSIMEFYRRLIALGFPARNYFVDTSFYMDSIGGLEALRQLCGPKDDCFTKLCTFKVSDREHGQIGVHTRHDGHRITFECPMPVELSWLSEVTGIEFTEVKML